jgi:predicted heme/steroid binding protein
MSQVALHNNASDAWIVYMGKVYDITTSEWDMAHIESQYWGTDITSAITSNHSTLSTPISQIAIEVMLEPVLIGYLD